MLITIFSKGFLTGLFMTGGLGPIGILCLRRSLSKGFSAGFATGLGAAIVDFLYSIIGFLGINIISEHLVKNSTLFRILSGCMFFAYGVKTLFSSPPETNSPMVNINLLSDFSSGALLTIANPITMLPLMALITSLGLTELSTNVMAVVLFGTAVFSGSIFWWTILSISAQRIRTKINTKVLNLFNVMCAVGLILFSIITILSTILNINI